MALDLVAGATGVDGGVVIDPQGRVLGFGFLLGGQTFIDEDPSHGADTTRHADTLPLIVKLPWWWRRPTGP